jgi:diaminohydroxyphosphoribosylaminopyrimidine deaminase/5-amino-6-(5-phosphoribosylamino)uracil reductase
MELVGEATWAAILAAARAAEGLSETNESATFAVGQDARMLPVRPEDPAALLIWRPGSGWKTALPAADPRTPVLDLYLPICSATAARPLTVGHIGQSLDGFIATHAGESRWVTGEENLRHMHRLRALCDAVIVGAGTVAADDPQLTTRLVEGPNPLRVVLDPGRRLADDHRVFSDTSAHTLYVCAASLTPSGEHHHGSAEVLGVADDGEGGLDLAALIRVLRTRGCTRVFVEGGGVTVSLFLEAKLLDRLHVAIAPLLIGDGRPAIRLRPPDTLGDCHRPRYRVFRMGADVLFDCDLTAGEDQASQPHAGPSISRVI